MNILRNLMGYITSFLFFIFHFSFYPKNTQLQIFFHTLDIVCVFMKPKLLVEYKVYWRSQAIIKYFLSLFGKFWECICCRNMVLRFFCSIIKIIQGNKRNPWTFTSYCQLGWLRHKYYDKIQIHYWLKSFDISI